MKLIIKKEKGKSIEYFIDSNSNASSSDSTASTQLACRSPLTPFIPRPVNIGNMSEREWYAAYKPYVDDIVDRVISYVTMLYVENHEITFEEGKLKRNIRQMIYESSSSKNKRFYFLK